MQRVFTGEPRIANYSVAALETKGMEGQTFQSRGYLTFKLNGCRALSGNPASGVDPFRAQLHEDLTHESKCSIHEVGAFEF